MRLSGRACMAPEAPRLSVPSELRAAPWHQERKTFEHVLRCCTPRNVAESGCRGQRRHEVMLRGRYERRDELSGG